MLQHGVIELAVGFDFALEDAVLNGFSVFAGNDGALRGVVRREEILLANRLVIFVADALEDIPAGAIQGGLYGLNLGQQTPDGFVVIFVSGSLLGELAFEVGQLTSGSHEGWRHREYRATHREGWSWPFPSGIVSQCGPFGQR